MDVIESFDETIRQTAPVLLAGPGIILVLTGLFLWPAGLRLLRPLAAFFAATVGLVCAWFFTDRSLVPMLALGVLPVLCAMFLEKPIVVLLGATLGAAAVLAAPLVVNPAFRDAIAEQVSAFPTSEEASLLEIPEYVERVTGWTAEWLDVFWGRVPTALKGVAAGMAVFVLLLGVAAWRWVCALTCSALGTAMILSGVALLVLAKGPQTIPYIEDKYPYLWPVAGVMLAVGTLLNRWLCPYVPKPSKRTRRQSDQGVEK